MTEMTLQETIKAYNEANVLYQRALKIKDPITATILSDLLSDLGEQIVKKQKSDNELLVLAGQRTVSVL